MSLLVCGGRFVWCEAWLKKRGKEEGEQSRAHIHPTVKSFMNKKINVLYFPLTPVSVCLERGGFPVKWSKRGGVSAVLGKPATPDALKLWCNRQDPPSILQQRCLEQ